MEKSRPRAFLIAYAILLVLLFYGLVRILDTAGRKFFLLEFIGLLILLLISLGAFMSYGKMVGRTLFFVSFLLYLSNLVLIWYFKDKLYLVLLLLAVLGFVISFPRRRQKAAVPLSKVPKKAEELHSMIFEEPKEESSVKSKSTTAKSAITYSPGKYVASKNSNVYHEPKCDWAKKIEKSRQVWFDDKKDAIEKGFRMHDCVQ